MVLHFSATRYACYLRDLRVPVIVWLAIFAACKRDAPPPQIEQAPHARILRFEASSSSVPAGEKVTLSWQTDQALHVFVQGRVPDNDSTDQAGIVESLALDTNATFTLHAKNKDGTEAIATTQVSIIATPSETAILQFSATPRTIVAGERAVLSWEVINASSVRIDGVVENAALSGSATVDPLTTTTYVLTAIGASGVKTQPLEVVVEETMPPPPPPEGACSDPARGDRVAWFEEVTGALPRPIVPAGTSFFGSGGGLADLNGDGLVDLVLPSRGGPIVVLRNLGGLVFEEVAQRSGIDSRMPAAGVALGDLDGDGDDDLVLLGIQQSLLYMNDGAGTFTRAVSAPLELATAAESALLADLDNDGRLEILLDIFGRDLSTTNPEGRADRLFHNMGAMTFEDISIEAGLNELGQTWVSSLVDADHDGTLDLYLANDTFSQDFGGGVRMDTALERDALFINHAEGVGPRLSESSAAFGLDTPHSSMGGLIGDFDGDGLFDLYVSNLGKNPLYLAQTDGPFIERSEELGVAGIRRNSDKCADLDPDCLLVSWGAAFEDFDNDGASELLVTNGGFSGEKSQPPLLFVRTPGLDPVRYEERDPGLGCFDGRAVLPVDLDGDGDLDLVVVARNSPVRVFETHAPPENRWLRVKLEGHASNRAGIGAVLSLELDDGTRLLRAIGSGGVVHSSRVPEAHFGLGTKHATALTISWPSGKLQAIAPVDENRVLSIVEPD